MIKKFNDFFLNKITFLVSSLVAILCWLCWLIVRCIDYTDTKNIVFAGLFFIFIGLLIFAYFKGEKNLQKSMLTALLLLLIVDLFEMIDHFAGKDEPNISFIIVSSINLFLVVVFFVCHLLQQSDHVGKIVAIIINQCCCWVIVASFVHLITKAIMGEFDIHLVIYSFAVVFTLFFLICIETRISGYKNIRLEKIKNGSWDDEAKKQAKSIFKI